MKRACVGVLSKDYLLGAQAFLKSLIINTPGFNIPFIIYTWEDFNFSGLKDIYPNIIFKKINSKLYEDSKCFSQHRVWKYNVFCRLEMFKLQKYDYLFYFDFDMLVLKNIEHLFELQYDFAAASTTNNAKWFNGGFFIVSNKYLNKKTFNALLALSKSRNWEGNEALLNSFFYNKVHFMEGQYNTITIDAFNIHNASILHYVGEKKPWHHGTLTDRYPFLCFQANSPIVLTKALKLFDYYKELALV
jgi:lipopolysaccharide biosynthesis glycosyltransferase